MQHCRIRLFPSYFLYFYLMNLQILLFGITTDLLGTNSITIQIENNISVAQFKQALVAQYPKLETLSSYAIAVNETYANDDLILQENDVIAIIPPVSGG